MGIASTPSLGLSTNANGGLVGPIPFWDEGRNVPSPQPGSVVTGADGAKYILAKATGVIPPNTNVVLTEPAMTVAAGAGDWYSQTAAIPINNYAWFRASIQGGGVPPVNTAPSAFSAGQWSVEDAASGGTATVTISALPSDGGSAITAIQYKAGAGAWTNSGIASTGSFNITGLTNGAAVNVLVRAVNAIGNGPDSDAKSVTPTAAPSSETAWTPMMIGAKSGQTARDPSSFKTVTATQAVPGDPVETWSDVSGNARDLVSAAATAGASTTATRAPLGPVETLGGVTASPLRMNNGVLTHRYLGPASGFAMASGALGDIVFMFARFRPPATALTRVAMGNSAGNFNVNVAISSTTAAGQVYTGGVTGTPKTDTTTRLEIVVHQKAAASGNNYNLRINGSEILSPDGAGSSVASTSRAVLGNYYGTTNAGADMDVFEYWILPQGTTRANVQRLEGWCAHTYGQQALLPADHPYKSAPPMVPTGTTSTVGWVDANFVTSQARQTWLGPMVELQADSYDGLVATDPPVDGSSQIWGFPYSLTTAERARLKSEYFPGDGTGYQFLRFPLGFAYRGLRNIDGVSGLAKNIGERFAGQNASITELMSAVSANGGGLRAEYWSPAPHWKTNSAYGGGAGQQNTNPSPAELWAGGSYPRTASLASIRTSDVTQYEAQTTAFAAAVINDLEYLHQNVAPVRGFSLQNEATNSTNDSYGHCYYSDPVVYADVLYKVQQGIAGSTILATYGGQPNAITIDAASYQGFFTGFSAHPAFAGTWAASRHHIPAHYGDGDYPKGQAATWITGSSGKANINNEFEYFTLPGNDPWQFANTALVQANWMRVLSAPTHNPMIHIAKPIGQTSTSSNTKGYAVVAARLPAPFSQAPSTPGDPFPAVGHGEWISQGVNANAVKMFSKNIPAGSKIMPSEYTVGSGQQIVPFVTPAGKRGYVIVNRSAPTTFAGADLALTLSFSKQANVVGKLYSDVADGSVIASASGVSSRVVTVAKDTAQVWMEQ